MDHNTLKIDDEFREIESKTVDERKRITLGELAKDSKRVRLYTNKRGEILIIPVVEIPASEIWLFQNKDALHSVKKGLNDAADGKIVKVDPHAL
jgi:hypothetical protein